jgi:hypothetical protein
MKNLFFSLVLLILCSSFTTNRSANDDVPACTTVHTSCGVTGSACGNTLSDLLEAIQDLEEWMCGGGAER